MVTGDAAAGRFAGSAAFDPAYLAAIVESSDDGIIGKDLSGTVRSWNRGAEAIFGYTSREVLGGSIRRLFPPDRVHEEDLILARIRAGERVDHFETIRRRKDGSDVPVSITISPIRAMDGTIIGASKIVRDISEQQALQSQLLKAKARLEQVVVERTAALAERDLLLREVYHRVKNNLQIVDGLLMMQVNRITDTQSREALTTVRDQIFSLSLVHQQLMTSSDLRTFDIAPFLRELAANVVGGAAGQGIELVVDACQLHVGLDFAGPLGLLVTELVTNSLKHAFPDGVGTIAVVLRRAPCRTVVLSVSDDGQGRSQGPPDAISTGLGTRLIKRLVSQLEGEMITRHNLGAHTEIHLPLPECA